MVESLIVLSCILPPFLFLLISLTFQFSNKIVRLVFPCLMILMGIICLILVACLKNRLEDYILGILGIFLIVMGFFDMRQHTKDSIPEKREE